MNELKNLSEKERASLLTFPAYISLLASHSNNQLDEAESRAATKLAYTKTFSSDPLLSEFYKEADKNFEQTLQKVQNELPSEKKERVDAIRKKLWEIEKILLKLTEPYALAIHRSMKSFKDHVSKAHHNVLIDFIFPIPIPGLTEQ
jgi:hypothetical protein